MKRAALLAVLLQVAAGEMVLAEDSIWTSGPVRSIRLRKISSDCPIVFMGVEGGESVSFPNRIDLHDSATFAAGGSEFVLKDLKGIPTNRLCASETGARWSCGNAARVFVGNFFRGRTVICKVEREPGKILLSQCRTRA